MQSPRTTFTFARHHIAKLRLERLWGEATLDQVLFAEGIVFRAARLFDALLLVAGLTLIGWATFLALQPDVYEATSRVAKQSQILTEGRSIQR
jgi:hypothetical protein